MAAATPRCGLPSSTRSTWKVRDGQVTNRPFHVVIGVTVGGRRDVLGIGAGEGGEGAKYRLPAVTEFKDRGVDDVCVVVCDGPASPRGGHGCR